MDAREETEQEEEWVEGGDSLRILRALRGKKVLSVWASDDEEHLLFETQEAGKMLFSAQGDCCSSSWFADLIGMEALIGEKVVSVELLEPGDWGNVEDGRCKEESDQAYGFELKSAKGSAQVIFRNSSNGYYGGNLARGNPDAQMRFCRVSGDWVGAGNWPEDKARSVREDRELSRLFEEIGAQEKTEGKPKRKNKAPARL